MGKKIDKINIILSSYVITTIISSPGELGIKFPFFKFRIYLKLNL